MSTILVAEDNAAERGLLVRALQSDGHSVLEAENGQIALQLFLANPTAVAVLVSDVEMPELDGIELARRGLTANASLKIILISGHASALEKAADLVAKGARTLVKPVALEKVRAEVRAFTG
jgi:CheY-like chemotaxis protein